MRFGFCLPSEGPLARPDSVVTLAQRAEELGYFAVSVSDHIVIPEVIAAPYPYSADHKVGFPADCLEQMTTLSYLAGKTKDVRLMTSIMVAPHRNPVLTAKMLANLDLLSGGRLIVGAGAGWLEEEFAALGVPPFKERGRVFDEYLKVYRELWDRRVSSYKGEFVEFSDMVLSPKPLQKPHIPIWVGGESKSAMRRAATLADGWYPTPNNTSRPMHTLAELTDAVKEFRSMAEEASRDPGDLTIGLGDVKPRWLGEPWKDRLFSGSLDKIRKDAEECESAGVGYLGVNIRGKTVEETVENMRVFADGVLTR
jgi:probable F420-dependent oxidoreductase